jgi:hypothetical protein
LWLRVECTLFGNLQSRARTNTVLVIGLYELLGNPTTYLIEPPGPLMCYWNIIYYLIITIYFLFEWVCDCCLTPSEQCFSYIIVRTRWAMFQLYHRENKVSNVSAISSWEQGEQCFSYIIVRTRWAMFQLYHRENKVSNVSVISSWGPLCTRQTLLVGFL